MMAKAVLRKDGRILGEIPIQIESATDFRQGVQAAYDEFRRSFPSLSLFDEGVSVSFEKLDPEKLPQSYD